MSMILKYGFLFVCYVSKKYLEVEGIRDRCIGWRCDVEMKNSESKFLQQYD